MVFSSPTFLFLFLPVFLAVYFAVSLRAKTHVILVASYAFYAWWRPSYILLLAGVTLWTFLSARWVAAANAPVTRRRRLTMSVVGNLGAFFYFKYLGFLTATAARLSELTGAGTVPLIDIVLPIGLSFYVFQAISYVVDVHRGDVAVERNLPRFAAYLAFFSQLIAGPILRYSDLASQFEHRRHSVEVFAAGATRFMIGFVKKVLIADSISVIADTIFTLRDPSFSEAWLGTAAYAAQLYFDFSAYSDMAIGLGAMLGFSFRENFDFPYRCTSLADFWRRWHISLSTWLRDYLYIPLRGNRGSRARTYANVFITMLLGGLWHGAGWTFIAWGAWHGIFLILERWADSAGHLARVPSWVHRLAVVAIVLGGWVWFRAADASQALAFLSAMADPAHWRLSADVEWQLSRESLLALSVACISMLLPRPEWLDPKRASERMLLPASLGLLGMFGFAVSTVYARGHSPFLYFQF